MSSVVAAITRDHRANPFGDTAPSNHNETVAATICEIVRILNRLMGILEGLQKHQEPDADDFMRGWGEPGGDIES